MGKFLGHVIVSSAEAREGKLYPKTFDRVLQHSADEGEEPTECDCVGAIAQEAVNDEVRAKFGSGLKTQWAAFIAAYPQHGNVPFDPKWQELRDVTYASDRGHWFSARHVFKTERMAAHPLSGRPDPKHVRCKGTGMVGDDVVAAREGLFQSASPTIREHGQVPALLENPPFALFLPDGVAAISDLPETWSKYGATWPAAVRALLEPRRAMAFAVIAFSD